MLCSLCGLKPWSFVVKGMARFDRQDRAYNLYIAYYMHIVAYRFGNIAILPDLLALAVRPSVCFLCAAAYRR